MAIEFGPILPQALITLMSVALGALIGYLSASRIARLNARLAAGAKLRTAFAPELAEMRLKRTYKSSHNVQTLLNGAFPRHAAAIEEYRFFVRRKDQAAAYQQAWEDYSGNMDFLDYYMAEEGEKPPPERFRERVQAILRFTDRGCTWWPWRWRW